MNISNYINHSPDAFRNDSNYNTNNYNLRPKYDTSENKNFFDNSKNNLSYINNNSNSNNNSGLDRSPSQATRTTRPNLSPDIS